MNFYTIFYKPEGLEEQRFLSEAREKMGPYSNVGNLMPVRLASRYDDIYIVRNVSKPLEELGYTTLMPVVTREEVIALRQGLEDGSKEILDYRKRVVYSGDQFCINANLYVPDLNEINDELIDYLAKNPKLMQEMHWRKFEELLEVLFKAKGYETELGPGSGDGGVDIRMVSKNGIVGDFLTLVQAKRYSDKNRIKLSPVQALYGVLESEKASSGLFVTTSTFEPCAVRFAESNPYRLQLADKHDIREWLKDYSH